MRGVCLLLALCLALVSPGHLAAATWTLADGNNATVQACFDGASPCVGRVSGDTIVIPNGTWTWTAKVVWPTGISMTLSGTSQAGTIILDHVSRAGSRDNILAIQGGAGVTTRLTTLTVDGRSTSTYYNGFECGEVSINAGVTPQWRIDHVTFLVERCHAYYILESNGVMDHNTFTSYLGAQLMGYIFNGGQSYGDQAWAAATALGTGSSWVFVEDNTFQIANTTDPAGYALDSYQGGKFVFRHNAVTDMAVDAHGTESGGRIRSVRAFEIYSNVFTLTNGRTFPEPVGMRGGTGVIWGNSQSSGFDHGAAFANYRMGQDFDFFGGCSDTSPFDRNNATVHASGTHSGSNGATVLTASGSPGWTTNQWQGYALVNMSTAWTSNMPSTATAKAFGYILSNTANTATVGLGHQGETVLTWHNGDTFTIRKATDCMDGTGRGVGEAVCADGANNDRPYLCSGSPGTIGWVNQALEPVYLWSNTGTNATVIVSNFSSQAAAGVHYIDNGSTAMPGYTAYTYPHPLTSGDSPPAAPPLFRTHQR